jgi:tRNA G10  N-methylase Trm11
MVPQKTVELNAATVLYNKLTSGKGIELLAVSDGTKTLIGYTAIIQDIDAYSARDQARPFRDAKVGMLPPKLAQIIINLAVGIIDDRSRISDLRGTRATEIESDRSRNIDLRKTGASKIQDQRSKVCILDAFCGTGVVLQEATLMDYDVYGSDLEPRMVQYSIDNLKWLDEKHPDLGDYRRVEIGNAENHKWDFSKIEEKSKIFVAGETYLGQPLSALPISEHLSKIIYEVNLLHHKFLENISSQVPSGTRFCLAVPTWRGKREFLHLPMLDYLDDLGYTRMRFKHAENKDLIYHRENQVVGRELLVLEKR